jgi:hypothetical protein
LIITFPENFPIEKKLQFHIEGLNQFVSDVWNRRSFAVLMCSSAPLLQEDDATITATELDLNLGK